MTESSGVGVCGSRRSQTEQRMSERTRDRNDRHCVTTRFAWRMLMAAWLLSISVPAMAQYPLLWYGRVNHQPSGAASIVADGANGAVCYNWSGTVSGAIIGATRYLDEASTVNMPVIMQIPQGWVRSGDGNSIQQFVAGVKDHPALSGWYIYDEPDETGTSVEEGIIAYEAIKSESDAPIYGAINANRADVQIQYKDSYDIMLGFRYPFHTGSEEFEGLEFDELPPEVPGGPALLPGWKDQVEETKQAAILNGKGFVNILQATGKAHFTTRLPTEAEFRFMVFYSIVVHDVDGLSFWARHHIDTSPADASGPYKEDGVTWRQQIFIPMMDEFASYGDAVDAGPVAGAVISSNPIVKAQVYHDAAEDRDFLLAVNEEGVAASAELQLSQLYTYNRARILKTGEEYDIIGGRIQYDFDRYDTVSFELIRRPVNGATQGEAYGLNVDYGALQVPKHPLVQLSGEGGSEQDSAESAGVGTVASVDALEVSTMGELGGNRAFVHSAASGQAIDLLNGLITADAGIATSSTTVLSLCQQSGNPLSREGAASFANLQIAGQSYGDYEAPPNTIITVPGVARVILNEQLAAGDLQTTSSLRVNLMRVEILNVTNPGEVDGQITVASAFSHLDFDPAAVEFEGFVTGGGWIGAKKAKANFGFVAAPTTDEGFNGSLNYNDHVTRTKIKSQSVTSFDGDHLSGTVTFGGNCSVDHEPGFTYQVTTTDVAEPGKGNDVFQLSVFDQAGNVVYSSDSFGTVLQGGNVQLHCD